MQSNQIPRLRTFVGAAFVALPLVGAPVAAQDAYPARPIEVVVPYAAGGASDIVVRTIQKALDGKLPQPLVVLNKPGAGGSLGNREVRDADADGYTLLSTHQGLSVNQALGVTDFNYTEFDLIAETGVVELVFAVPKDSPFETFKEVIDAARERPDQITHATSLGSVVHFATLAMSDSTGAQLRYVETGGGGARLPAVAGNQVETSLFGVAEVMPFYQSGDIRVLAIFAAERWPEMPEVPTARELGYDFPPISVGYWWFAPKNTPPDRLGIIRGALRQAMENEAVRQDFANRGFRVTFVEGDTFQQAVARDHETIMGLAQKFGIKPQ